MEERELPATWAWATLADLGPIVSGGTPASKDAECFDGEIAWVTPADLTGYTAKTISRGRRNLSAKGLASCSARVMPKRTVIFSSRAPIGYVAIAANEIATNQGFKSVVPHEEIDESFVYYYLRAAKQLAEENASGTTFKEISGSRFARLPIPIAPLPEQQRIVEKIDTLFAELDKGEEALREVQKLLARYRQSVLKAAVTGALTADWRAANPPTETGQDLLARILQERRNTWQSRSRYKEPVEPEVGNLPELPEGWVWASVDQLLRRSLANGRSVPDAEIGYPVLRLTALKNGMIDLVERKIGAWDEEAASGFKVQQHDILVSRGNGSKRLVGLGGIVSAEPDGVAYPDTMIRIAPLLTYVWAPWFIQVWNGPFVRSQIESSAKTTAGIYKINQDDIRGFAVPLPPMAEQQAIAATVQERLSQAAVTLVWAETELKRSAALRQSILKDAFSGKLVPQDPSDEPAAKLLERIRAARSDKPKVKRNKAVA